MTFSLYFQKSHSLHLHQTPQMHNSKINRRNTLFTKKIEIYYPSTQVWFEELGTSVKLRPIWQCRRGVPAPAPNRWQAWTREIVSTDSYLFVRMSASPKALFLLSPRPNHTCRGRQICAMATLLFLLSAPLLYAKSSRNPSSTTCWFKPRNAIANVLTISIPIHPKSLNC